MDFQSRFTPPTSSMTRGQQPPLRHSHSHHNTGTHIDPGADPCLMVTAAAFSTPVNSHPVIMPWSFSSSLPHHPVINFSENSLRQGPLIYYVYIPARVYRNFDKENFKNISLLKSLKRNFFEKKFVQVELVQLQQTFPLSFLVDPLCSVYFIYIDIKKYTKSYI